MAQLTPRGMPRETLVRVFNVLDPTDTGWVAGVELQYLEALTCSDQPSAVEEVREKQLNHYKL